MAIEIHFEKRINNATVIRDVDTRQQRHHAFLTLLAGLFVLGLLFYGWQQYQYRNAGYDMEKAKEVRQKLIESNDRLTAERDFRGSLPQIASRAHKELGMVEPAPGRQWFTLSPEPTAPAPGDSTPKLALKAEN
jgi:cell division protein FtsL